MNFKISGRDLGMVVIGIGICAIASYKKFIKPLQRSIKDLSEKNDELTNGLEEANLKLDDSEEKRAKLTVENRHKDDEIKYLRDENQFYRDNYNKMSGVIL